MPDIFDQVAATPNRSAPAGDIFDQIAPSAAAQASPPPLNSAEPAVAPASAGGGRDYYGEALGWANRHIAQPVTAIRDEVNRSLLDIPKVFTTPNEPAYPGAGPAGKALQFLAPAGRLAKDVMAPAMAPFSVGSLPINEPIIEPLAQGFTDTMKIAAGGKMGPDQHWHVPDPNLDEIYNQVGGVLPFVAMEGGIHGAKRIGPPTVEAQVARAHQQMAAAKMDPQAAAAATPAPGAALDALDLPGRTERGTAEAAQLYNRATRPQHGGLEQPEALLPKVEAPPEPGVIPQHQQEPAGPIVVPPTARAQMDIEQTQAADAAATAERAQQAAADQQARAAEAAAREQAQQPFQVADRRTVAPQPGDLAPVPPPARFIGMTKGPALDLQNPPQMAEPRVQPPLIDRRAPQPAGALPGAPVRLYRGEQVPGTGQGVPDWVRDNEKFKRSADVEGRWFTTKETEAQQYAQEAGEHGRVVSLEVPEHELQGYRPEADAEAGKFVHATKRGTAHDEYFLPREVAAKARPAERSAAPAAVTPPAGLVERSAEPSLAGVAAPQNDVAASEARRARAQANEAERLARETAAQAAARPVDESRVEPAVAAPTDAARPEQRPALAAVSEEPRVDAAREPVVESPTVTPKVGAGDKAPEPQQQTPVGATDGRNIITEKHVRDVLDNAESFEHYGLRVIPDTQKVKIGDTLKSSYEWVDNQRTRKALSGTSAIELKRGWVGDVNDVTSEGIADAIAGIKKYSGQRVAIVGSNDRTYGADEREVVMPKARVLGIVGELPKPNATERETVYHGTPHQFDEFKHNELGIHFGTKAQAESRLKTLKAESGRVIAGKLKPDAKFIEMPDLGGFNNLPEVLDSTVLKKLLGREYFQKIDAARDAQYAKLRQQYGSKEWVSGLTPEGLAKLREWERAPMAEIRAKLIAKGYDGIKYFNAHEGHGYSYDIFDPKKTLDIEKPSSDTLPPPSAGGVLPSEPAVKPPAADVPRETSAPAVEDWPEPRVETPTLEQRSQDPHTLRVEPTVEVSEKGRNFEGRYLRAALETAKEQQPDAERIFVKVPGDGSFTIPNKPEALDAAMKKADRMAVPQSREGARPVPRSPEEFDNGKYIEQLEKEIRDGEKELRYATGTAKGDYLREQLKAARENLAEARKQTPEVQPPEAEEPRVGAVGAGKGGTTLRGGLAIADPAAWKEAFPSAGEWAARGKEKLGAALDDKLTPGDLEKGILRQKRGELEQKKAQLYQELEQHAKRWAKASAAESRSFIGAIEGGGRGDKFAAIKNPADRALAQNLAGMLDERRARIQALKPGALERFITDYFPHFWEKPSQASKVFQLVLGSKRPFQGPASFLKKRTIPTFEEGIAKGLKPVTYNPVDLALLKVHEMDRFIMAHEAMEVMKRTAADAEKADNPAALKLATYAEVGSKREQLLQRLGWKKYEDRVGTVYGPKGITLREWQDKNVSEALDQVLENFGVEHERGVDLPKRHPRALGVSYTGADRIETRFGTELNVKAHELMHQLDLHHDLENRLVRKPYNEELRKLSDLTYEGSDPAMVPDHFKKYVRSGPEKIAHVLEMYASNRERLRRLAPHTYSFLQDLIATDERLAPLQDMQRGISYKQNDTEVPIKGLNIRGYYWGPSEAVAAFNNNLSPGLMGRSRLYDLYRGAGNVMNQAQLGLSAFHAGFTSLDASISDVALGIEQLSRGNVKGLKAAGRGLTMISPIENAVVGHRLMQEYLKPGSYAKYADTARAVTVAGGRVGIDPFYKNEAMRSFQTAVKDGRYGVAAGRAIPATMEALAKPIMEWLVPRQKLGVFHKMATDILERARDGEWDDNRIRHEVGKAWDSVDNRMGQVVYDNLFINRVVKDLALGSVRSVGWNLGTIRELAGGAKDTALQAARKATGREAEITHRMAYMVALPLVAGMYGALYHFASGNGAPKELKDYFFPKGPDGNRVSLPSYMKDIYAWRNHPGETASNKIHPLLGTIAEMLRNRDFYGNEIRNQDDPIVQQAEQAAKFLGKQALPFSVRNWQQATKQGGNLGERAQSFVGITPAPGYINHTAAYNKALEYFTTNRGEGTRTTAQAEIYERRHDLEREIRQGKLGHEQLIAKIRSGEISAADAKAAYQGSHKEPILKLFQQLPIEQALKVWELADEDERKTLRQPLARKGVQLRARTGEQREQLKAQWLKALGKKPPAADTNGEPRVVAVSNET